ncbi:MAG TPA: NAD(P)H-dependent oxidoreductase subunit E, partial [Acidimicrobiales bacterium]|nr:NAD(P)H-dependent oxidoreductase subunit E [Acidimicrobiales bacterium]
MPRRDRTETPPPRELSPLEARLMELAAGVAAAEPLGALLPVLHAIQGEYGYLPDETWPCVAEVLNISQAEVVGTATFYKDFRRTPGGARQMQVCAAEACQAVGAVALAEHARARLGVDFGQTAANGVSLDRVFCLGNCALGPSLMVDGRVVGKVDEAVLDSLLPAPPERGGGARIRAGGAGRGEAQLAFVPCDTAARSVGADEVAGQLTVVAAGAGVPLTLVRNG